MATPYSNVPGDILHAVLIGCSLYRNVSFLFYQRIMSWYGRSSHGPYDAECMNFVPRCPKSGMGAPEKRRRDFFTFKTSQKEVQHRSICNHHNYNNQQVIVKNIHDTMSAMPSTLHSLGSVILCFASSSAHI